MKGKNRKKSVSKFLFQSAFLSCIQRQHSLFHPAQVHQETTLTSNFPLQGPTIQCGFIALSHTVQYA